MKKDGPYTKCVNVRKRPCAGLWTCFAKDTYSYDEYFKRYGLFEYHQNKRNFLKIIFDVITEDAPVQGVEAIRKIGTIYSVTTKL